MEFILKRCDECKRYFVDLFKCPCCGSDNITNEIEIDDYDDEEFEKSVNIYEQINKIIHKVSNTSIFIGSTSESLKNAKYLARYLSYKQHIFKSIKILLWNKDVFDIGEITIESLIRTSKMVDMAVFVFTGEDTLITRGNCYHTIRDNLLFEYGLFIGAVGVKKVFILMEENNDIKVPSDLYGVNYISLNNNTKMEDIADRIAKKAKNIFVEKVNTYLIKYCESFESEYDEIYKNQIKEIRKEKRENDIKNEQINEKIVEIRYKIEHGVFNTGIYIDVDKMDQINNIYGKENGNKVLNIIAKIIKKTIKPFENFFCKLYGDSFFILLNSEKVDGFEITKSILKNISKFYWTEAIGGLYVSCSAGIANINYIIENEGNVKLVTQESVDNFIKKAIQGCIIAKQKGGNKFISVKELSIWMQEKEIVNTVS